MHDSTSVSREACDRLAAEAQMLAGAIQLIVIAQASN